MDDPELLTLVLIPLLTVDAPTNSDGVDKQFKLTITEEGSLKVRLVCVCVISK